MLHDIPQLGIFFINGFKQEFGNAFFLAVAFVAGEHNYELVVACIERSLVGNGCEQRTVEQRTAFVLDYRCDKGHGGRSAHRNKVLAQGFLVVPDAFAVDDIGSSYLQRAGIGTVGCIVKGQQLLRQLLEDKVKAEDTAAFNPVAHAEVTLIGDVVLDNLACAQRLSRHI